MNINPILKLSEVSHLTKRVSALIGVASMALTLPAFAIEPPVDANAPKPKKDQAAEVPAEKQQKKQAMIGLGGAPASKTLSYHLGLPEGTGLTLFHVVEGSPAAKAGMAVHDVMTAFDGKPIGSQQDLRDAIHSNKPGDEVVIKYRHAGKALEKKVLLAERPKHFGDGRAPGMNQRWMFQGLGAEIPEADRKKMEADMKKHVKEFEKRIQKDGVLRFNMKGMQGNGKGGFKMNAATSMTMSDKEGSVTMKMVDGKKEVIIKDKKGEVVFEGPYDTPQDKAALPEKMADRVKAINFGKMDGDFLNLKIRPGGMVAPPAPKEEEDAQ